MHGTLVRVPLIIFFAVFKCRIQNLLIFRKEYRDEREIAENQRRSN